MSFIKAIALTTAIAATTSALPFGNILSRSIQGVHVFPQTGGQELSLTDTDLSQLILVTIGRGVQNYTCPSGSTKPIQTGANTGAVAQLFDVTSAIASSQAFEASLQSNFVDDLTNTAVQNPRPVLTDVPSDGTELGPLNGEFQKVCYHEFNDAGTPSFDCGAHGLILGTKLEAVDPPADAQKSLDGAKALPWLNLAAKEGSRDITKVIRVVTAGGSPPSGCEGYAPEDVISVDYAAQYWFFNNGTLSG